MKSAHSKMSKQWTKKVACEFFILFKNLVNVTPLKITEVLSATDRPDKKFYFRKILTLKGNHWKCISAKIPANNTEIFNTDSYSFNINGRTFEVTLFDSAEEVGYHSMLNYDIEKYTCCEMREIRPDGSLRYSFIFAFDIVTMEFLEFFELCQYSANGYYRDSVDTEDIEIELRKSFSKN